MSFKNVNHTIYFQGNTQYDNTGDILINKSLVELFRSFGVLIINDYKLPHFYVEALGLTENELSSRKGTGFNRLLILGALKSLFNRERRVFLIAGPPGHVFGNSNDKIKRNLASTVFFTALSIMGVKIIRIGFSMGPIGKEQGWSERIRAKATDFYLVRDSISLQLAHSLGIGKARFFPDFAWIYEVEGKNNINSRKNQIILSFRDSVYKESSAEEYCDALIEKLNEILKGLDGCYKIKIAYQVKNDYQFCDKIYNRLCTNFELDFNKHQITLENAKDTYESAFAIITNRLHGALLAAKYGAIPIILTDTNNHLKIKGIYSDAGISELLLNINDNNRNLSKCVNSLFSNRDFLFKKLDGKEREYSDLSQSMMKEIFD